MKEYLGKDRRNMVVDGEVRSTADDYDGIDETDDGRIIDKAISGIDPKPLEQNHRSREQYDAAALAQGALFLIDQDERSKGIRTSVEQHPSAQNVPPQELSLVASGIIAAYKDEVERLEHYKKHVDTSVAARGAYIAFLRNLNRLSTYDREEIAVALGHGRDYFKGHTTQASPGKTQPRELDWLERQANDDTLKGE